ncbi:MAG: flagellar biosynthesis protein FliQ [Woeseiaceae bacterium]
MTPETVTTIGQQALWVTMLIAAPLLLSALAVGLLVGMFQAATQINEMTMSFIPKLLVVVAALIIFGPWMLSVIVDYTQQLVEQIPALIS